MKKKSWIFLVFISVLAIFVTGCGGKQSTDKATIELSQDTNTFQSKGISFVYNENLKPLTKVIYEEDRKDIDSRFEAIGSSYDDLVKKLLENNGIAFFQYDDKPFLTQLSYASNSNPIFKLNHNNDDEIQESLESSLVDNLPENAYDIEIDRYPIEGINAVYIKYSGKASYNKDIDLISVRVNFIEDKNLHSFTFNTSSDSFEERVSYLHEALDSISFQ